MPTVELEAEEARTKERYRVSASAEGLTVASATNRWHFAPAELVKKVVLTDGIFMRGSLLPLLDGKRVGLTVGPEGAMSIYRGLGPEVALAWVLGQRVRYSIVIGLLFVFTSFPVPGDESSGLEAIPFDVFGMGLGLGLLLMAGLARVRPRRWDRLHGRRHDRGRL